jgi:hypothetical protein
MDGGEGGTDDLAGQGRGGTGEWGQGRAAAEGGVSLQKVRLVSQMMTSDVRALQPRH